VFYCLIEPFKEYRVLADNLEKLAALRANGSLTEEEFARAKERLLHPEQSGPNDPLVSASKTFRRSRTDRWLGGVCGGIARATGVESWVWRLLFAVLFFGAGFGLLLYLLLWIFAPSE
jgi:phage shock protein PspC (stress-responsive transcriptional regulator)